MFIYLIIVYLLFVYCLFVCLFIYVLFKILIIFGIKGILLLSPSLNSVMCIGKLKFTMDICKCNTVLSPSPFFLNLNGNMFHQVPNDYSINILNCNSTWMKHTILSCLVLDGRWWWWVCGDNDWKFKEKNVQNTNVVDILRLQKMCVDLFHEIYVIGSCSHKNVHTEW